MMNDSMPVREQGEGPREMHEAAIAALMADQERQALARPATDAAMSVVSTLSDLNEGPLGQSGAAQNRSLEHARIQADMMRRRGVIDTAPTESWSRHSLAYADVVEKLDAKYRMALDAFMASYLTTQVVETSTPYDSVRTAIGDLAKNHQKAIAESPTLMEIIYCSTGFDMGLDRDKRLYILEAIMASLGVEVG